MKTLSFLLLTARLLPILVIGLGTSSVNGQNIALPCNYSFNKVDPFTKDTILITAPIIFFPCVLSPALLSKLEVKYLEKVEEHEGKKAYYTPEIRAIKEQVLNDYVSAIDSVKGGNSKISFARINSKFFLIMNLYGDDSIKAIGDSCILLNEKGETLSMLLQPFKSRPQTLDAGATFSHFAELTKDGLWWLKNTPPIRVRLYWAGGPSDHDVINPPQIIENLKCLTK